MWQYIAAGAGFAVAAAGTIVTTAAARKVVGPGRKKTMQAEISAGSVRLPRTALTILAGEYGAWINGRNAHIRVGAVTASDANFVHREILDTHNLHGISGTVVAEWSGHVFPGPEALGDDWEEVTLQTPAGTAPAWSIGSVSDTWVIHVHGIRTTRVTGLRTVPAALQQGFHSLVPSFRGDGEGPATPGGTSMLGQEEAPDIEAALEYAVDQGAERLILVGWSMGAQMALSLAHSPKWRDRVAGVVLVAPALDWGAAIENGAAQAGLPRIISTAVQGLLSTPLVCRLAGIKRPIDFAALRWAGRNTDVETLIVHSVADAEVPFSTSKEYASRNPSTVQLVEYPGKAHAWEYNQSPDKFNAIVGEWIARL